MLRYSNECGFKQENVSVLAFQLNIRLITYLNCGDSSFGKTLNRCRRAH